MLCTATPTLRTIAVSSKLQPSLFAPYQYCTAAPVDHVAQKHALSPKRHLLARNPLRSSFNSARAASTSAEAPTETATSGQLNPGTLDWNTFFKLRRQRRFWQLGSSVTSGAGGLVGGASVVAQNDLVCEICHTRDFTFLNTCPIHFLCSRATLEGLLSL